MLKIRNKVGLALSAIAAVLFSSVVLVGPAKADESSAVLSPMGAGASSLNSMLITEGFEMKLRYGTGVTGVNLSSAASFSGTAVNPSIHYVISSASVGLEITTDPDGSYAGGATRVNGTSISNTVANDGYLSVNSTSPYVKFKLSQSHLTSVSPAVTVTVTPYLDMDGTAGLSNGDPTGTAYTINFVPWSAMGAALSVEALTVGDRGVTSSFTVTAGTIRWSQLDGVFGVALNSTGDTTTNNYTVSAQATGVSAPSTNTITGATLADGNYSLSPAVLTAPGSLSPLTEVGAVNSVSAILYYFASDPGANGNISALGSRVLVAETTVAVTEQRAQGLTLSAVTSANIIKVGDNAADARYNSAFTLTAFPYSASATTSIAVASTLTVSSATGIEFDADSGVILGGTTYTSSAAFAAASLAVPAGTTTVAVSTFGQDYDATDNMVLILKSQLQSVTLTVNLKQVDLTVAYAETTVAGLAGATKSFAVTVKDQFGVSTPRTDLRVKGSLALGGSTSTAVAGVTAGAATVAISPTPAARTGSATLTLQTQYFNQLVQDWENIGNADTVTWNVYNYAAGTDAFTSRTATASASISYGVAAYSWSGVVSVVIVNSFSPITVTAPGLVIENNDETTVTASDTLTVTPAGQTQNLRFASKKAGTYTVTFTTGTVTTTSEVTIHAAGHDKGASISFDKSNIAAGETSTITGTLVDANGNPVATGGTASVAVTYTGKGLPYGNSTTMQTDADGKFTFQVLVLSTEKGDAAITATYKPTGVASSTLNITTVHGLTVGAATAAAADQKVNAGSFKGYVAVYAKGYEGQRLSAKVGNDWVVVESLASNFERVVEFTGAGYTIAVRIYIDRVLVDTITVTTR